MSWFYIWCEKTTKFHCSGCHLGRHWVSSKAQCPANLQTKLAVSLIHEERRPQHNHMLRSKSHFFTNIADAMSEVTPSNNKYLCDVTEDRKVYSYYVSYSEIIQSEFASCVVGNNNHLPLLQLTASMKRILIFPAFVSRTIWDVNEMFYYIVWSACTGLSLCMSRTTLNYDVYVPSTIPINWAVANWFVWNKVKIRHTANSIDISIVNKLLKFISAAYSRSRIYLMMQNYGFPMIDTFVRH